MQKMQRLKLIALILFVAGGALLLITDNAANRRVHAFSSGPPAGYTRAPGEEPEACAECHVNSDAGTGQISINAPQSYVPGQTYQITVTHTNNDQTRQRWGFQLTALDDSEQKAGNLSPLDNLTQTLDNQGPFPNRQYIEHTSLGTFFGQHNGASWTFNWTAPASDVGPVTFYAAGNHANGDANSSGDNIYFTFNTALPTAAGPDFAISATPASQTVLQGNSTSYNVNVTPTGGFNGAVTLSVSGNPPGTNASFNPQPVNVTDANLQTSVLTINTTPAAAIGTYLLTINATSGSLQHTETVTLVINSPTSADLLLTKTASPNPAQVGTTLSYRVVVTNTGPATATNVQFTDTLPSNVTFVSATPDKGACSGTGPINCNLGSLVLNESVATTIVVTPTATGQITNTASASASEPDPNTANNSASVTTTIEPQSLAPSMLDPNLSVRTLASGLNQPTSMAFIGAGDLLVLEKATGKVQRVYNGQIHSTALDLAVNSASERGLLGLALHPDFSSNGFVYLFWTESSTGVDTTATAEVPLLGNRVDRFIWNGATLAFDRNLIQLRAYQEDAGQPLRGNHNGGVLRFGPDGKLYIIMGDNGRRGLLQNIASGGPIPDDQYGGPEPDNAHLTGVVLRLNDDGSTPVDNPFFNVNSGLSGEAAANIKKVYAYGVRNSFGMAFDPVSGHLWTQENGDDSFDEINRVGAGFNGGWIQLMGPSSRVAEYKAIETSRPGGLQQIRWSPSLIADTPQQALSRLYQLPNSQYTEPEFSWKYAVAPSPIGFVRGQSIGAQFDGNLFVGASRTTLSGGYLFRFPLTNDRLHLAPVDGRLADRVADNADKFDLSESESLLVGQNFGVTTDIQTGPDGNLYIVSLSNGVIYEIYATTPTLFAANLTGAQEVPPTNSGATGTATILLSPDEKTARVSLSFNALSSGQSAAHIHGPAPSGTNAGVLFGLPLGQFSDYEINLTPTDVQNLKNGLLYINVHSLTFPNGEIRGQFTSSATASSLQLGASSYSVNENEGSLLVTVNRYGDSSSAVSIDYMTIDGTASEQSDYQLASGTLMFAAGQTSKTFSLLVTDDAYVEGAETLGIVLKNPQGGALAGSPLIASVTIIDDDHAPPTSNPIDDARFFVRQHYLDFLNREPDKGGLDYWTSQITNCGVDANCINIKRTDVSAAFFVEQEFQQTGFFLYRFTKAALGVRPTYEQFTRDRNALTVGAGLEASKQAFAEEFVQRPDFISKYGASSNCPDFVDALINTVQQGSAINMTARRTELIGECNIYANAGATQRARVVRKLIEYPEFVEAEYNPAFVLAEYFGYLKRNPDEGGYQFWLDVLNTRVPGNYRSMVCAFITSREYQERFSPVVPHNNTECSAIR
jgi:aldose sugar dehydrogenase